MRGRGHVVRSLCQISEDKLISGDHDRAINVWSIEKEECVESHFCHEDWIYDITSMPHGCDGSVVTASSDKSFCITALNDEFDIYEPAPFDYESLWEFEGGPQIYEYNGDAVFDRRQPDNDTNARKLWSSTNGSLEA